MTRLIGPLVRLRRRYAVVTVGGTSMKPTLTPGDQVLVRQVPPQRITPGQIVLFEQPQLPDAPDHFSQSQRQLLIKRVAAGPGHLAPPEVAPGQLVPPDHLVVLGDNRDESIDSRVYGFVPVASVLGVVVRLLHRPA